MSLISTDILNLLIAEPFSAKTKELFYEAVQQAIDNNVDGCAQLFNGLDCPDMYLKHSKVLAACAKQVPDFITKTTGMMSDHGIACMIKYALFSIYSVYKIFRTLQEQKAKIKFLYNLNPNDDRNFFGYIDIVSIGIDMAHLCIRVECFDVKRGEDMSMVFYPDASDKAILAATINLFECDNKTDVKQMLLDIPVTVLLWHDGSNQLDEVRNTLATLLGDVKII